MRIGNASAMGSPGMECLGDPPCATVQVRGHLSRTAALTLHFSRVYFQLKQVRVLGAGTRSWPQRLGKTSGYGTLAFRPRFKSTEHGYQLTFSHYSG